MTEHTPAGTMIRHNLGTTIHDETVVAESAVGYWIVEVGGSRFGGRFDTEIAAVRYASNFVPTHRATDTYRRFVDAIASGGA